MRWIEFEAYARRVFANSAADWYQDAARHAASLIQAHSVVRTQCLSIDLTAVFAANHAPADVTGWAAALTDDGTLKFVDQILAALAHRFEQRVDLVLKLTCPGDLLAGSGSAEPPGFDDLDDVATALAGLLRRHAERPIAGLLLEKSGSGELSADERDACEPLCSAARHYGWVTSLALPQAERVPATAADLDLDVLLLPQAPAGALAGSTLAPRIGGGLTSACWSGQPCGPFAADALLYGAIPQAATPETVLTVLATLP